MTVAIWLRVGDPDFEPRESVFRVFMLWHDITLGCLEKAGQNENAESRSALCLSFLVCKMRITVLTGCENLVGADSCKLRKVPSRWGAPLGVSLLEPSAGQCMGPLVLNLPRTESTC